MERSQIDDLEDWEVLPDDGFFDYKHGDKKGFSASNHSYFDQKGLVDVNYFICPLSPPRCLQLPMNYSGSNTSTDLISPVSVEFVVEKKPDRELEDEKVPIVEINLSPVILDTLKAPNLADPDAVVQVSFKKIKETQFVDMKMDSHESSNRGIKPQLGVGSLQFEEKGEIRKGGELAQSPPKRVMEPTKGENFAAGESKEKGCWEGGGFNIWRWRLTGIGALCSLGAAAATICIIIFGHQKQKQQKPSKNLKIQIYADEQRIKQVMQQATRLNQALSAMRGVPLTRAHITFGGSYAEL